jgi:hypothetical protein
LVAWALTHGPTADERAAIEQRATAMLHAAIGRHATDLIELALKTFKADPNGAVQGGPDGESMRRCMEHFARPRRSRVWEWELNGNRALHVAVHRSRLSNCDVVKMLITAGADPNGTLLRFCHFSNQKSNQTGSRTSGG